MEERGVKQFLDIKEKGVLLHSLFLLEKHEEY